MSKTNIIAMIPARMGSTRLKMKNLALINNKPLMSYAIEAAIKSQVFNKVIINGDSRIFEKIANRYNAEFYLRPEHLGSSEAKSDEVVYDFLKNNPCDIVAWVNTIAPFQTAMDIKKALNFFIKENLDSLMTVKNEQVHCVYKDKAVNFDKNRIFDKTQDLTCVQPFVYTIMIWRANKFTKNFEKNGYAFFSGKTGFYPVKRLSSIIIKTKDDLMLADYMLRKTSAGNDFKLKYDKALNQG